MKRKIFTILGIPALALLMFGITVIGCEWNESDSSTPHSIKITGIPSEYDHDRVSIVLWDDKPGISEDGELDAIVVATGRGRISGDSATIELKDPTGANWDGIGPHHLQMSLDQIAHRTDGLFFVYAAGKTFEELGIKESDPIEEIDAKLPAWHIDGTVSEIPFTAFDFFHELPELEEEPDSDAIAAYLNYTDVANFGVANIGVANWMKILVSPSYEEKPVIKDPPHAAQLYNIDRARWMSKVPNSKRLSDMAIPGTHDSATFGIKSYELVTEVIAEWAKCQRDESNFKRQLEDGIRAFDIRVGTDGWLTHGGIDCWVKLTEAIDVFTQFLDAHPTETILACLRYESGTRSHYKQWVASAFEGKRAGYWYLENRIPTLGEVRKRIVLINGNDDTGKPGLWLRDFETQDDYDCGTWAQSGETRADMKGQKIVRFIEDTAAGKFDTKDPTHNKMLWNFWNHQANAFITIEWYANAINSFMWGRWWGGIYPRGVQCMDYYWHGNVLRVIHSPVNEIQTPPWSPT